MGFGGIEQTPAHASMTFGHQPSFFCFRYRPAGARQSSVA
jgi:hypothetical protein